MGKPRNRLGNFNEGIRGGKMDTKNERKTINGVIEKYQKDPAFHNWVDSIAWALKTKQFTIPELKQMVDLAIGIYEEIRMREYE